MEMGIKGREGGRETGEAEIRHCYLSSPCL